MPRVQPAARLGGRKPHGPIKFCCCCCSCGAGIEVCWACASITISKSLFCQKFPAASHTLTVRLHVRPTDHNPHCVTVLSLTRYRHIVRVLLSCAWWRRRTIPCTSAFCRALWGSHHPPPSLYLPPTAGLAAYTMLHHTYRVGCSTSLLRPASIAGLAAYRTASCLLE